MLERSQVRALETREVGNAARPAWLDTIAAAPIVLFVLGMYVYWFGIANRYLVFLYDHLGLGPFDVETRSRYWMAGFVTTGYVMVGYVSANWTLARLAAWRGWSYHPPSWHRVWRFCSAPLILGIPTITMTMSWPTLPPLDAVLSALAALLGLALALWPSELAAGRPVDLLWLALDGATLLPVLGLLRVAELALGETSHARLALLAVPISIHRVGRHDVAAALAWPPTAPPRQVLALGVAQTYLLFPALHNWSTWRSGHRYITSAFNLFPHSVLFQIAILALAAALVWGTVCWRNRWGSQSGQAP